ncbi:hypothetical protein CALVIDRAFT_540243 [Calocera viscosa TUFC12733]|uniref:Uncharacterized protein n=1 Tax=Calocera viscosa (strain TUFC12733) TaxID=1330018 RepID=A0A167J5F0_CALVF|nr:hypothetical protein CALVIDRAFT_540243 [Calocera viscosa TUFC12733]
MLRIDFANHGSPFRTMFLHLTALFNTSPGISRWSVSGLLSRSAHGRTFTFDGKPSRHCILAAQPVVHTTNDPSPTSHKRESTPFSSTTLEHTVVHFQRTGSTLCVGWRRSVRGALLALALVKLATATKEDVRIAAVKTARHIRRRAIAKGGTAVKIDWHCHVRDGLVEEGCHVGVVAVRDGNVGDHGVGT